MTPNQHILFKLPSRERPERFRDTLDNLYAHLVGDNFTVYCVLDEDDPFLPAYKLVLSQWGWGRINLVYDIGVSGSKIKAVNREIRMAWNGLLVNWSDDIRATVFGFDQLIRAAFQQHFPTGDGLLAIEDADEGDRIPIVYIADRKYHDRDGFIYHPAYESLFCDSESKIVAELRGRYAYEPGVLYSHNLAALGRFEMDDLHRDQQQIGWTVDKVTFDHRQKNGFFLDAEGKYTDI